jgi:hypothetical protein
VRRAGIICVLSAVALGATGAVAAPPKLARPPASCRGSTTVLIPTIGRAIGAAPIFAADFGAGRAKLHVANGPHTKYGWRVKVLVVVDAEQTETLSLSLRRVGSRRALWFRVGSRAPSTKPVLDPAHPPVPPEESSQWKEFPSYFFLPSAGCFRLEASWSGGSWARRFAGGR